MTTQGLGVFARQLAVASTFLCSLHAFGTLLPPPCAVETTHAASPIAFDLTETVRIVDPLRQIARRSPLAVTLSDDTSLTRLRFLAQRLETLDGRLKIVLNRHDTRIYRSWRAADQTHFGAEELESSRRIVFEWADWQDEHPEVIFFGALTETAIELLGESRTYREHLDQTVSETMTICERRTAEWRHGTDTDRRDAQTLERVLADPSDARWQVEGFFQLRNTWMAKIHFYRNQLKTHPEISHVDGVPTSPTLRYLADLEVAIDRLPYRSKEQDHAWTTFESELRRAFSEFYSQHDHYHLSPALLRAVWTTPQPRLLESSLVAPQLLLDKKLFL